MSMSNSNSRHLERRPSMKFPRIRPYLALALFLATVAATEAETHLERIRATGTIRIATNPGIEPMTMLRDGQLAGFDVDFAGELARHLGVEVEWVRFERLDDLTVLIRAGDFQGRFDVVISAMGIDRERTHHMIAVPYFKSGLTILTASSESRISTLESLVGRRVAAVVGSTEHGIVEQTQGITVAGVGNYEQCIAQLRAGEVDAAVLDLPVALQAAKRDPETLRVVAEPFEEEWYGIYMEKTALALFAELRKSVREMKSDGSFEALRQKWF